MHKKELTKLKIRLIRLIEILPSKEQREKQKTRNKERFRKWGIIPLSKPT